MTSINLSGSESAQVILALIADHLEGQDRFTLDTLEQGWKQTGLRAEDLIHGLSALIRDQHLRMESESGTQSVILSASGLKKLPPRGCGLQALSRNIKDQLERAKSRVSSDATPSPDEERRKGFK